MHLVGSLSTLFFASTFLLVLKVEAQPPQRPLCVSQFALVNYACASLPYTPLPPPSPEAPPPPPPILPPSPPPHPRPLPPKPTPTPPCPPDEDHDTCEHRHRRAHGHEHEHEHKHGHQHGHEHGHVHNHHTASPVEDNCCHWLQQLDDECVCDLLVHLPAFLSRPVHAYTLIVDDTCNVTYACGGRIKP